MTERRYSSTAGAYTLSVSAPDSSTSITLSSTAGLPTQFPYTLVLDVGTVAEEIVTVTNAAGPVLTVTRGEDGSAAQTHQAGATVRHMATARDFREPQQHIAAAAAHGVSSALVGASDVQTLQNKTLDDSNSIAQAAVTGLTSTLTDVQAAVQGAAFRWSGDISGTWTTKTLLTIPDQFGGQPYDVRYSVSTVGQSNVIIGVDVVGTQVASSLTAYPHTGWLPTPTGSIAVSLSHQTLAPFTGDCTVRLTKTVGSTLPATPLDILAVVIRNTEA